MIMTLPIRKENGKQRKFHVFAFLAVSLLTRPLTAGERALLLQTNSTGKNVHIIEVATNKVVGEITGLDMPHGVAVAPDRSRFYISNEGDSTLAVVDAKTLAITKRIPLTGRPNNIALHKDGRRLYVAIVDDPTGGVDVVDVIAQEKKKFIPVLGGAHNTFISPDSRYVVAGSVAGKNLTVIDTVTDQAAWTLFFESGVRPFTFESNPDGSTKRLFVQLSYLHGFAIVDFEKRREVGKVQLPELTEEMKRARVSSYAHGITLSPDGKIVWVVSDAGNSLYALSLPDLKLLGGAPVGEHPHWLSVTPDGKTVYVANASENSVSVVDAASRREVVRIQVGQAPKRSIVVVLPAE